MSLGDSVKYHFQLLGVFLLISQTSWLLLSIILGVLGAICYFSWELLLVLLQIFWSGFFLVLIGWTSLFFVKNNEAVYAFLIKYCGRQLTKKIFLCQTCRKIDCQLFFPTCCHAFHMLCIQHSDQYAEASICPKCAVKEKQQNIAIIIAILISLKISPMKAIKYLIFLAFICAFGSYLWEYWNFPMGLFQTPLVQGVE